VSILGGLTSKRNLPNGKSERIRQTHKRKEKKMEMTIQDLYDWGKKNNALNLPIELITTEWGNCNRVVKMEDTDGKNVVQLYCD
jgi:hypothetical protein